MAAYLPFNVFLGSALDTEFNPHVMNVYDVSVVALDLVHEEGQVPTLDITIRRPGWPGQSIGLLVPGAPTWIWLSYNPPSTSPYYGEIIPLFYGILIGIPSDLFKETIKIRYQSRSVNFIANKQAVAETLKTRPYYDPVFIDEKLRSDPDTIADAWSGLYHFPRLPTHGDFLTTFTDYLLGEDGTVVFDGVTNFAIYDSVRLTIGESPLTNIQVQGRVKWTQRTFGYVDLPPFSVATFTGDSFIDDFPKAGQSIGGGWSMEQSFVQDVYNIALTPEATMTYHWDAQAMFGTWTGGLSFPTLDIPAPECQEQTLDYSHTFPLLSTPVALTFQMSAAGSGGICQACAVTDQYGRCINVNKPQKFAEQGVLIPNWYLNCTGQLRYDSHRDFTEVVVFNVTSNIQPILTQPLVEQNTELIKVDGADVGQPLIDYDAWTNFAGQPVGLGQIIFPNNPTTPGGLSWQICTTAGTAGTTEPVFSDIPGTPTADNTVVWASMGPNPPTNMPSWTSNSPIPLGQVICYEPVEFDTNRGTFEPTGDSVYYLCTGPGTTNDVYSQVTWFPPPATSDVTVVLPSEVPYIPGPTYDATPGAQVGDGSVVWTSLGTSPAFLQIPIGGTPLNVTARCYFPTDRGLWSVEYLIAKARARLRKKARAVSLAWDCPFENAMFLSCRMNAALNDQRLPGGVASGKVSRYSLHADGDGKLRGHVEVGVSVGLNGGIHEVAGSPTYVELGYVAPGYQAYSGSYIAPEDVPDVTYSPPIFQPFDDGYNFPLGGSQVAPQGAFPGSITITRTSGQQAELTQGFFTQARLTESAAFIAAVSAAQGGDYLAASVDLQQAYNSIKLQVLLNNLAANPVWATLLLPPFTNGPFSGSYSLAVTPVEVYQGINLEAA